MAVNRYYSSVAVDTTLASGITSSSTSIVVSSTTGFPTSYPYTLAVDYDTGQEELINVVGAAGTTLTVGTTVGSASTTGRGVDGTTAQNHSAGAVVKHVISGRDMREAQEHIAATSAVHGVTGPLVGTTDTQTLTNKTLTSPTINGGTLTAGTVSGGSITGSVGGNPTFTGTVTLPATTSINSVSATEIGYLDGTTSNIQTQLDAKAPLASPTFTGTVTMGTGAVVAGTVSLPSTTSIGNVSATEIGYVDGVTSAIQTQLDAKAPLASPTFTGTVTLPTGVTGATGAITSNMIADGTIVNADINASAAIDPTKIAQTPYLLKQQVRYTSGSGTFTVADYPGARALRVRMVGGGAGGAGQASGGNSGGGAGGYCEKLILGSLATTYSYAVGSGGGGASGASTVGSDGGNTTFSGTGTSMTASGGVASSGGYQPGAGGAATGGDINIAGQGSFTGSRGLTNSFGAAGGNSMLGLGGGQTAWSGSALAGNDGTGYGSGGGGGANAANGGAGKGGIIIIDVFV